MSDPMLNSLQESQIEQIQNKMADIKNQNTDFRVIMIKIKANNTEIHEQARAFKLCLIGRAADNDFIVEDPACSRNHCIIYFKQDRLVVRDLFSRSGTFINGTKIPAFEDQFLVEKDIIQVNEDIFTVHHVTKVEKINPLAPELTTEGCADVKCPYCNKQAEEFVNHLQELTQNVQTVCELIKEQKKQQALIQSSIQSAVNLAKKLEDAQNVLYTADIFEDKKQLKLKESKKEVKESKKELKESKKDEELDINELKQEEAPKKSRLGSVFGMFSKMFKSNSKSQVIEEKPTQEGDLGVADLNINEQITQEPPTQEKQQEPAVPQYEFDGKIQE
ncbi:FHA_domain-containing protein [Hexamita inflata]|uniref:FHA domain-containing protein n=1 Tax=Hexamita inflata TaxID=28002 RepID=A0AA86P5N3_9EUKA|nr:FHA domain-containing protein [Hexamita inflata]